MPLIAIIDSRLPDREPKRVYPKTRTLPRTKQCPHCNQWFVPGGGFNSHKARCATMQRPQRHYERPENLRLMGDTF